MLKIIWHYFGEDAAGCEADNNELQREPNHRRRTLQGSGATHLHLAAAFHYIFPPTVNLNESSCTFHVTDIECVPSYFSSQRPPFNYRPHVEHDSIRVILLHPAGDVSAEVECTMEHVTLSEYNKNLIDHYTALSYVWGDSTKKQEIVVDGCSFYITASLHSALRHIRDTKGVIRVWADALCINQSDTTERNQQVQQMGSVYSVARHTIIYLGEASVETDNLFMDLDSLCTVKRAPISIALINSKFNDTEQDNLYNAIETHVVKNAWFTRVWTLQELLLSHDPWVQCGMKRIKWDDLVQLSTLTSPGKKHVSRSSEEKSPNLLILDFLLVEQEEKSSDLGVLEYMHRARRNLQDYIEGNNSKNTLLALLQLRRGLGASDARDMIYAHLGIAVDSLVGQPAIKVDYSKSYQELFTDIAVYFIEHYGDYRILAHVEENRLEKSRADLPSWVPDWTSKKDILSDIIAPDSMMSRPRISASLSPSCSSDGKWQLNCKGTFLARIKRVGSKVLHFAHFTREEIRQAWTKSWPGSEQSSGDLTLEITDDSVVPVWYKSRFDRLIVEVLTFAGLAKSKPALYYVAALRNLWDTYALALYRSFGGKEVVDIPLHPMALLVIFAFCLGDRTRQLLLQRVQGDAQRQVVRILEMAHQALEGRRLCLCDSNSDFPNYEDFLFAQGALVPPSAQIGDLICEMDGDRFLVLRAIEPVGKFPKKGAAFEFVGICNFQLCSYERAIERTFVLQ
ncbi:HET-domain-containing protein [Hyaloscypha hepaticicola]|uniref:HET-domain-containing protein n=1 Tax=Hyaloscypha hepaticicola TaxID=2082293 RepID=A0A2J6Q292_9HELO|nr:HET-domain-containing protein [Hyaloscypha hepaticicola]